MKQDILEIVWAAVDHVNATASDEKVIPKELDAPLLGSDEGIDSLAFVNLVVALEDEVRKQKRVSVVIVNEETLAMEEHPFRTVRSLIDYVAKLLDETERDAQPLGNFREREQSVFHDLTLL